MYSPYYTDSPLGVAWNLLLALIPVALGWLTGRLILLSRHRWWLWGAILLSGLLWLIYLPNSCYLVTELRHILASPFGSTLYARARLDSTSAITLLLYAAFYFTYSGFGMVAFALAIRPIARAIRSRGWNLLPGGILFFALMSLGVYLGLIRRYNSWDLMDRPLEIWNAVAVLSTRPGTMLFLLLFGLFLWLAYEAVDIWIDGFMLRFGRRRTAEAA